MTGWPGALPVRSGRRTHPRSAPGLPARMDGVSPKCGANWTIRSWGTWRARGFRGRHPIAAGRCRAPGAIPEEPQRAPAGKGRVCSAATPLPHHRPDRPDPRLPSSSRKRPRSRRGRHPRRPPYGPNTPMPSPHKGRDPHRRHSPTNHRRTTAFVEDCIPVGESGSATDRACSPTSPPATSTAGSGSESVPAPAARPEARRAAALPGDGNPSSQSHPMHRTRYSPGRQTGPLHERQRRPGKRIPTCPHSTEGRRLIDPRLHRFMQQSGRCRGLRNRGPALGAPGPPHRRLPGPRIGAATACPTKYGTGTGSAPIAGNDPQNIIPIRKPRHITERKGLTNRPVEIY